MFSLAEQVWDDISSFGGTATSFHSKRNLDVRLTFSIVIFRIFAKTLFGVGLLRANSNQEEPDTLNIVMSSRLILPDLTSSPTVLR